MKSSWILLVFLSSNIFAQLNTLPKSDTLNTTIEHFHVLQLDTSVRHGLLVKVNFEGDTLEKGYYYNNEPVGKWLYYYEDGELKTFTNHGKATHKLWQTNGYQVKTAEGFQDLSISSPPHYLRNSRFSPHIRYPRSAKRMMIEGKVLVTITLDEKGKFEWEINKTAFNSTDNDATQDLIKEVEHYLKRNNYRWIPAIRNNKFVTVRFRTVVQFKLK